MGFQHTLNASQALVQQWIGRAMATRLADSSYLLVWQDTDPLNPSSERDIYAQRIDVDGETPIGETFRVNVATAGSQQRPWAIALPDGGYVITWTSFSGTTFTSSSIGDIYARTFSLDGIPLGGEQRINLITDGNQFHSRGFYNELTDEVEIGWTNTTSTGGFIRGHSYDVTATGIATTNTAAEEAVIPAALDFRTGAKPGGTPFIRNATELLNGRTVLGLEVNYSTSGVVHDVDGGIAIALDLDTDNWIFVPVETSATLRSSVSVAPLDFGASFIVAWSEESESNLGHPVAKFALLDADATAIGTPVELATDAYYPTARQLFDGSVLFAWTDATGAGAFLKWYESDGTTLTALTPNPIRFFESEVDKTFVGPNVLPSEQGGALVFVGIHEGSGPPTLPQSKPAVLGYGTAEGAEEVFTALPAESAGQQTVGRAFPARLNDGSYVIAWQEPDLSQSEIFAQHLASDGTTPIGAAFRVNATTSGIQVRPAVIALPDNGYVVTWTSFSGTDLSTGDIYARRFASNNTPFGTGDFLANNGATAGNQFHSRGFYNNNGTPTDATDDELSIAWTSTSSGVPGGVLVGEGYRLTASGIGSLPDGFHPGPIGGTDFTAGSKPGGTPFLRNIITVSSPAFVVGGFEVQYRDAGGVLQDSDGGFVVGPPVSGDVQFVTMIETDAAIRTSSPIVTGLTGGRVLLTWSQENEANLGHPDAFFSIQPVSALSTTGPTPLGTPVLVASDAFYPAARQLADGTIVIAWSDANGQGIKARVYDFEGDPISGVLEVMPDVGVGASAHVPVAPTVLPGTSTDALIFANVHTGAGALANPFVTTSISGWETEPFDAFLPFTRIGLQGIETALLSLEDLYANLPGIFGTDGADNLVDETGGARAMFGGLGNDNLNAGAGDDRLDGGVGADTMNGGTGSDFYVVDDAGDVIVDDPADPGVDTVQVGINAFTLPESFENLLFEFAGDVTGTGNSADNSIASGTGNDVLDGGAGDDEIASGEGNDTLEGGTGEDLIDGGAGGGDTAVYDGAETDFTILRILLGKQGGFTLNGASAEEIVALTDKQGRADRMVHVEKVKFGDVEKSLTGADALRASRTVTADKYLSDDGAKGAMKGAAKNEVLDGLDGDDTLEGLGGNDTLLGRAGKDVLKGGTGNDMLDGGTESDTLEGGAGNDLYVIDVAPTPQTIDTIVEIATGGIDAISTSLDAFNMVTSVNGATFIEILEHVGDTAFAGTGNEGANIIRGNAGNDTLSGAGGADRLLGFAGNDALDGGAGADRLEGGLGDDTFVIDNALDVVVEKLGEGTDTIQTARASLSLAGLHPVTLALLYANVENLTYTGAGNFAGTGNAAPNVITGGIGNDTLIGGGGDDTLVGGAGSDVHNGGAGTLDVARFAGQRSDYSVSLLVGDIAQLAVGDVRDRLIGVERIVFDLGTAAPEDDVTLGVLAPLDAGNPSTTWLLYNVPTYKSDSLVGTADPDTMLGLEGNDTLDGGAGDDTMSGGAGNDTYLVDSATDVVTELAGQGTADLVRAAAASFTLGANVEQLLYTGESAFTGTGSEQANRITGGAANDTLNGLGGNDTLIGGAGNDTLDGGLGADRMEGGTGDDTYFVNLLPNLVTGAPGDLVVEALGEGTDTVNASVSYTLPSNVENLVLIGTAHLNGTGNALPNTLTGNAGNNVLSGGGENDTFFASGGNDTFAGGLGNDTLNLASLAFTFAEKSKPGGFRVERPDLQTVLIIDADTGQRVTVKGAWSAASGDQGIETFVFSDQPAVTLAQLIEATASAFVDNFPGTADTDTFDGLAGNDTINGLAGNDALAGGAGDDTLDGGAGDDTLAGGLGNDTYFVDGAGDVVTELLGQGTDTVKTALGAMTLADKANVERLEYTGGDTFVGTGNGQANTLVGGAGNDLLDGGAGADRLQGGLGDDSYVIDNPLDVVVEALDQGNDTVSSSANYVLAANVDNLILTGGALNINGTGNLLPNTLTGNDGNNVLSGGAGDDTLAGGAGNDRYTGGLGADRFDFTAALNASTNRDTITDFAVGDQLRLDSTVFMTLAVGALDDGAFASGAGLTQAAEADDRIVYNRTTGALYYDADGVDGEAAIQFAILSTHPLSLSAADFSVI